MPNWVHEQRGAKHLPSPTPPQKGLFSAMKLLELAMKAVLSEGKISGKLGNEPKKGNSVPAGCLQPTAGWVLAMHGAEL